MVLDRHSEDDAIKAYRQLTSVRLAGTPKELLGIATDLASSFSDSEWRDLFDMELLLCSGKSYKAGGESIIKKYGEEDFDQLDGGGPPRLPSILSLACLARSLVYIGGKQELRRAQKLLEKLYRIVLPRKDLDLVVAWAVLHYRALAYDEIGRKDEAVLLYDEVLGVFMDDPPTLQECDANCAATSLGNTMVTLFALGRFDEIISKFDRFEVIRRKAPRIPNDDINLADAFRYVCCAYRPLLGGMADDMLKRTTELCHAAFNQAPESGAIAAYNLAHLLYIQSEDTNDVDLRGRAVEFFRKAYELFQFDPFSIRSSAGKLSALCLLQFLDDEDAGFSVKAILEPAGFTAEMQTKRRSEAAIARAFLKRALNQHSIFFEGVENELNHHLELLTRSRTIEDKKALHILRRWNSFTPAVPVPGRLRGKGGGYFVVWSGTGVVIDPGPDFLELFMQAEYSLEDINAIILTHAHFDHTCDLEPILTLVHERNESLSRDGGTAHSVDIYVSEGVAEKSLNWLLALKRRQDSSVGEIHLVNVKPRRPPSARQFAIGDISVTPIPTKHDDIVSEDTCFGVILALRGGTPIRTIGITSDTAWSEDLAQWFIDCDALIAHLGSVSVKELLVNSLFRFDEKTYEEMERGGFLTNRLAASFGFGAEKESVFPGLRHREALNELKDALVFGTAPPGKARSLRPDPENRLRLRTNHLGLTGISNLAMSFSGSYFILSEFGEELGIYRAELAQALAEVLRESSKATFLTGDAGLIIDLAEGRVVCDICKEPVPREEIVEVASLHGEREVIRVCHRCLHRDRELLVKRMRITKFNLAELERLSKR